MFTRILQEKPLNEICVGKGMEMLAQRVSRDDLLDQLENIVAAYCSKEA